MKYFGGLTKLARRYQSAARGRLGRPAELTENRRLAHDYPFANFGLGDASREGGGFCSAEEVWGLVSPA